MHIVTQCPGVSTLREYQVCGVGACCPRGRTIDSHRAACSVIIAPTNRSCCIGIAPCCDDAEDSIGNIDTGKSTFGTTTDTCSIRATCSCDSTAADGNNAAFTKFTTTYTRGRVAACGCNITTTDSNITASVRISAADAGAGACTIAISAGIECAGALDGKRVFIARSIVGRLNTRIILMESLYDVRRTIGQDDSSIAQASNARMLVSIIIFMDTNDINAIERHSGASCDGNLHGVMGCIERAHQYIAILSNIFGSEC